MQFEKLLSGGDLRSIVKTGSIISQIKNQDNFDELFNLLLHTDRLVVMRAADAIEKITINNPGYLAKHKKNILELSRVAKNKELKWHLALLISRLPLDKKEFIKVWKLLTNWTKDKTNSRIVRTNSLQALFNLLKQKAELKNHFKILLHEIEKENIPSINARIKNIRKQIARQVL